MAQENVLYNGFHKIYEVETEVEDRKVTRERLHLPSAVGGLVKDEDGRIALVSQYRPVIGLNTKEIPAGVLDKNLTEKETLIEELEEECGLNRDEVLFVNEEPLTKYFMVAGSSDATMAIYDVHVNGSQENQKIHDDNDVDAVEWVTLEEFGKLIKEGQIIDSKTLLAYHHAQKK